VIRLLPLESEGIDVRTRLAILMLIFVAAPCALVAQHLEIGAFANYVNFDRDGFPPQAFGLGGRLDVNLHRHLQLEFETAYDFKHAQFRALKASSSLTLTESKMGVLHGNVGLKVQSRGGSFFLFVKGGANRFDTEVNSTTTSGFPTITTLTQSTQNSFTKGVLYPGGGLGFHAGPLGIRLDVGDEIYWENGARHNVRVTFGPTFRF
jgi:hypothetical protein